MFHCPNIAVIMEVIPYKDKGGTKKDQVAEMFDNISPKYDFLNHFLSLGIDILWRKKAIKLLRPLKPKKILDIATGTGDFALEAMSLNPDKIVGVDISKGMLEVGREKMKKRGISDRIEMLDGDSERLPFEENNFDAVIVAFGVRNFEHLKKGLGDMHRVLRPGGQVVILEFSKPTRFPIKQIYQFYFKWILPKIGRLVSKDNAAYTYLPDSVKAFPDGDRFIGILEEIGFTNTKCKPLTLGISSIYTGVK